MLLKTISGILLLFCVFYSFSYKWIFSLPLVTEQAKYYRIMSYNTENFFDTFHDSLKNDHDFLPEGKYKWNYKKYKQKVNNICKVIVSAGEWKSPVIVGLVEVENDHCLRDLVYNSPLARMNYGFIHEESPDSRGIDVALLYRKCCFKPLFHKAIRISFPENPAKKTRDILYVKGILGSHDTLNLFVNHWPSRLGGELESEPLRNYIAGVLKKNTDSIFHRNGNAFIIIMGDFNDEPDNSSIILKLKAKLNTNVLVNTELYNLSYRLYKAGEGSYKYHGQWSMIDQIMVSGTLLQNSSALHTSPQDIHVFKPAFLLEQDKSYTGSKPKRTYNGFRYNAGFSDHLPVYIDIQHN